jgi:hypothetical protein
METMSRTFLVLIMLCVASASTAQPVRQSDARPSMLYFGTAMLDDGTLALHLRLTSDGKPVSDTLTYRVSDRAYDNVLRHLGGLRPGETKQFRPWEGLNVGNRTIKKPTLRFRIEPYKNLPLLSRRFDVITAHQICFNGHKTENLWGVDEWDFFLKRHRRKLPQFRRHYRARI